jgi:anhydro-N-acetylmuramic acid kinase
VNKIKEKASKKIIGLMSGTSVDGVTLAITDISGTGSNIQIKVQHYKTYSYFEELREKIFQAFSLQKSNTKLVCELNFLLGSYFANCIELFLREFNVKSSEVDLIGSHGQTVWHQPEAGLFHDLCRRSTLQIGEPAVIAMKTGIPVVADFRKADIAAGGHGAPLTPYLDFVLHRSNTVNRVLQNIGGIANLTYLPVNARQEEVLAFDTGPGNMIIDSVIVHLSNGDKKYDHNGVNASRGEVNQELLRKLLRHPYYTRKPPKTTGREVFGQQYTEEILKVAEKTQMDSDDIVATVTELTALTICNSYEFLGPVDEVYLSGGGSRNPHLVSRIEENLDGVKVMDYGILGFSSEAKEAVLMALLANEHIMNTPSNIPAATGATQKVRLGVLYNPPHKSN